ncbi:serine hydrolase domain-containing protein [Sphingomonas sp. MMS24-J13]|uniref:serine hydrolase domain-containing protein n=1 Tax=Sphingomonas sp. MMS24-J13 TaxID=3238686 RepID=UPI00384C5783
MTEGAHGLRGKGLAEDRLQYLKSVIEADIASGRYSGAAIMVGRHGELALSEALGTWRSDDPRPLALDTVISLFSLTKAFTNVLILRAIELGRFALTTRVVDLLPEFAGSPRNTIRIDHLLTHTSGLPPVFTPRAGLPIDRLDVVIQAIFDGVHGSEAPGSSVAYAPMVAHALMGEILQRTDPAGRRYRDIVAEDLLAPLGMLDTAIGVRADLKDRHAVPEIPTAFAATHPSSTVAGPHGAFEDPDAEMPWVGGVSTVRDIWRFAEMLRRGGELDGQRILSPRTLDVATLNRTGDMPNTLYRGMALARGWQPWPAYIGLGFALRGDAICHTQFGTLATARTFGNFGAGSTLFWVSPELDMTFACLTTRLVPEWDNYDRFQRLSDIAISAVL